MEINSLAEAAKPAPAGAARTLRLRAPTRSGSLPKTRSGKIMRRLLRSIAKGEAITQDVSTLENPAILEQLKVSL